MKIFYSFLLIFLSFPLFSQGPLPRIETNLDDVYNLFSLSGQGVVTVIIDRGIDYRHPDFIDSNGDTRIAYIFDMIDNTGASDPDNPYGVGTIFDEAEINQALANSSPPLTMDRYGHGTATAGIMAGNGTGTAGLQFQGVAPESKLIVIKITHDAFPAFGSQPGQAGFFNPALIPIALDFAKDKIEELSMPSVTLMNIGSIGGPTDGTSLVCRKIDEFIAAGHPFVCGVGDDGGADNHASATLTQGQTIEVQVSKGEAGFLRFDLWYSEDDRFTVSIQRPNGTIMGPYAAPGGPTAAVDQNLGDIFMYHRGANQEFSQATSNRRQLLIDFSGVTGVYKVILTGTQVTSSGVFHATLNPSTYFNNNKFVSHVVAGTSIADYASSVNGITPGDYVVNNDWFDVNGVFRDITGQGEDGELWIGSSEGPTQDNRRGIDFVAPGEVCFAAYSPDTYYSNFTFNLVQDGNSNYGIQNAVSAAAPLSTGIIALMLEVNPNLTPAQIKSIIQMSCSADAFTGVVPNNTWGYGKIDALNTIENTFLTVGIEELTVGNDLIGVFPNPFQEAINLKVSDPAMEIQSVEIINSLGQIMVVERNISSDELISGLNFLNSGLYVIGINTNKGYFTKKMIKE